MNLKLDLNDYYLLFGAVVSLLVIIGYIVNFIKNKGHSDISIIVKKEDKNFYLVFENTGTVDIFDFNIHSIKNDKGLIDVIVEKSFIPKKIPKGTPPQKMIIGMSFEKSLPYYIDISWKTGKNKLHKNTKNIYNLSV